ELSRLLKSLDIMPFWRDKLTEISYNPLTRVDVRRMYKLGVLDESEVKKSYLNIGYNENDAEKMTAFTKKYEGDTEKELTKSAIDKAFKNDIIFRRQADIKSISDKIFSEDLKNIFDTS
ncbi:unnamed protein product, partial [marine sediment metagenome]